MKTSANGATLNISLEERRNVTLKAQCFVNGLPGLHIYASMWFVQLLKLYRINMNGENPLEAIRSIKIVGMSRTNYSFLNPSMRQQKNLVSFIAFLHAEM